MIITKLKGGLGNQMFQYAFGRSLSLDHKTDLKLDVSGYTQNLINETKRSFALDVFNIRADVATAEDVKKLKYPHGIFSKAVLFARMKLIRNFNITFATSLTKVKDNSYIDGFFQDERFFNKHHEEIKNDFILRNSLRSEALKREKDIETSENSISLHIRRGDYVQDEKTNAYHGTCSIDYYKAAYAQITSQYGENPVVFIFSDDIEWAKENLSLPCLMQFIPLPPLIADYESLILMSKCRHHIIANSSFSWWAAWLGEKDGSLVVAPHQWTKTIAYPESPVPERWIRI